MFGVFACSRLSEVTDPWEQLERKSTKQDYSSLAFWIHTETRHSYVAEGEEKQEEEQGSIQSDGMNEVASV